MFDCQRTRVSCFILESRQCGRLSTHSYRQLATLASHGCHDICWTDGAGFGASAVNSAVFSFPHPLIPSVRTNSGPEFIAHASRRSEFFAKHKVDDNAHMKERELAYLQSAAHVHALVRSMGYRPAHSPAVLRAAVDMLQPSPMDAAELVEQAKEFFRTFAVIVPSGLEQLPSAWLGDLPRLVWDSRKPHWTMIPYMIRHMGIECGMLCLAFAQEMPTSGDRRTAWDRLRIHLNLGLRPNLWAPLSIDLKRRIWMCRPDLRSELSHLSY